jgi:hypothetical protein
LGGILFKYGIQILLKYTEGMCVFKTLSKRG